MLSRIKSFLTGADAAVPEPGAGDVLADAAVAVFVEAALLDGEIDAAERRTISGILVERFGLSEEDAGGLIETAVADPDHANRIYAATRTIRDAYSEEDRIDIVEMLWRVAYADGHLHDYEANLVRRTAGLLYVRDQDSGRARKRALRGLGLDDSE